MFFLKKLGKCGAAMTEYAIILAFVSTVGLSFSGDSGLGGVVKNVIENVNKVFNMASSTNHDNNKYNVVMSDDSLGYEDLVSGTVNGIFDIMGDDLALASSVYVKYDSNGNFVSFTYWYNDPIKGNTKKELTNLDTSSFLGNSGYTFAPGNTQIMLNNGLVYSRNDGNGQDTRIQLVDSNGKRYYAHYSDTNSNWYVDKNYGRDNTRF